jgi:hypothetical protein
MLADRLPRGWRSSSTLALPSPRLKLKKSASHDCSTAEAQHLWDQEDEVARGCSRASASVLQRLTSPIPCSSPACIRRVQYTFRRRFPQARRWASGQLSPGALSLRILYGILMRSAPPLTNHEWIAVVVLQNFPHDLQGPSTTIGALHTPHGGNGSILPSPHHGTRPDPLPASGERKPYRQRHPDRRVRAHRSAVY